MIAIRALLMGADLDVFEQGDVWSRVATNGRSTPAAWSRSWRGTGRRRPPLSGSAAARCGSWSARTLGVLDAWAVGCNRSGRELRRP